jgi:hypothetical protein
MTQFNTRFKDRAIYLKKILEVFNLYIGTCFKEIFHGLENGHIKTT